VVDTPEIALAKAELRRQVRTLRRSLSSTQKIAEEANVCRLLTARYEGDKQLAIASYAALPDELSVDAWHVYLWAAGQPVWLPRVIAPGALSWHPVTDAAQLATGAYGIREPRAEVVPPELLPRSAMLLVPGVAFTGDGWRLGQGGGFYDRLLATHPGPTIGLAYACQRVAEVPRGSHDHPVRAVFFGG